MKLDLTSEEAQILVDALLAHPSPESFDFGPAYEAEKARAEALRKKILEASRRR